MTDETLNEKVDRFNRAASEGHNQAMHYSKAPICPTEKSFKSVIYHLDCAGWDVVRRNTLTESET
jgi:hypothetical protein